MKLPQRIFAYCNSCAWEGELVSAELPKDGFVKCPQCGEKVQSGTRPKLFVPGGLPPPLNHRSDPFCECAVCMAEVSRKIATDTLNRYKNRWANTFQKDKRNTIIEIPKISEYTHLKMNEDWITGIYNRTDGLDQSVAFYISSIQHLISALEFAVRLAEDKSSKFDGQASSEQEKGTVVIEIPKISEEDWIEIGEEALCIHSRQGVEDFVCFDMKDIPYLIEALRTSLSLWKLAGSPAFNSVSRRDG